ncbi:hypothetical protein WN943_007260 [Citrus x changshan-huyou]
MATTTATGWLITDSGGWNVCVGESEIDAKATKIASSLVEPSIQEPAMKPMMAKVPPRYVRPDIKDVMICNDDGNSSTEQLPVVDLQKLNNLLISIH